MGYNEDDASQITKLLTSRGKYGNITTQDVLDIFPWDYDENSLLDKHKASRRATELNSIYGWSVDGNAVSQLAMEYHQAKLDETKNALILYGAMKASLNSKSYYDEDAEISRTQTANKYWSNKAELEKYQKELAEIENAHLQWDSWQNYEKVVIDGQIYAKIGDKLYTKHGVERLQPSGHRYRLEGGSSIYQAGGVEGRSIPPSYVNYIIDTTIPYINDGKLVYESGNVRVVTNQYGGVISAITHFNE
jgi:hypothetical protein